MTLLSILPPATTNTFETGYGSNGKLGSRDISYHCCFVRRG